MSTVTVSVIATTPETVLDSHDEILAKPAT